MGNDLIFQNDYYVISKDFKLVEFNENVARTYEGIKVGDYCYKATMKRDEPCMHCPIAGHSDCDCPIYYDPFYKSWIEAIFTETSDGHYAVTCRPAKDRGMRVFDSLGKEDNDELIQELSGGAANHKISEMKARLNASEEEQTAQFEEIRALNAQLENNQVQLEELSSEQEARLQEISNLNKHLEQRMSIIQSMSKIYFTSFFVTLNDNTFVEISNQQFVRDYIGVKGNAQQSLLYVADHMVNDETREEFRDFIDFKTLDERMQGRQFITCEYFGKIAGWCQMYIIEGDRNDDGTLKTIFVATRTIHDEKRRELIQQNRLTEAKNAAEMANAAKTSFLFNMSHDIRTPMNAIMGFRDLLEKHQDDPEKRRDYLKKIDDASNVLLSIINNVLEMARIEKGTLESNETAWNGGQFADTIFSVFHEMMKEKDITYTYEADIKHEYLYMDTIKQREIFLNLMSNAIKYSKKGGTIRVRSEELPYDRDGWCIIKTTIEDNGIGMSEEFIPHIFDEFAREHNNTESGIEGTGLGMAIVKRLVDFLGGTIEVYSKLDVGTTITISIPHAIASKSNVVTYAGLEYDANLFQNQRILLAEDNELNAEIAIEVLEELGLKVDRAENGQICVDMLKNAAPEYYDLILMDIQMPVLNGYEATKLIRRLDDSEKANIPILAMTANAFEEDKKEALRVGMNGHLAKPVNTKTLMKEIAGLIH